MGPSIASGSQTCSGNWPLLPTAPAKISRPIAPAAVKPRCRVLPPAAGQRSRLDRSCAVVVEEQRAGLRKEPDDAEKKENIADARGEEGFLGRRSRRGFLIPEPDQQVGSESDESPST